MRRVLQGTAVVLVSVGFFAFMSNPPQDHEYQGVKKCGMCHKKDDQGAQLSVWEDSKHAKAFETLKSEESKKIAEEMGLSAEPWEAEECLKCHASGYQEGAAVDKKFKVEDGVQCETCHGPGGDYVNLHRKADKLEEAYANGFVKFDDVEAECRECHNEESPTFPADGFDFAASWEKVKHPIPAGE
jgi:hypothetical protein